MLRSTFPNSNIAISSTAGEIRGVEVTDDGAVITALCFDHTPVSSGSVQIQDHPNSFQAGHALAAQFNGKDTNYLLVLSDGALVNGSELIAGIEYGYSGNICVTGGLAGDGANFQSTAVGLNAPAGPGTILAIGFSGDHLKIGHGVMGGWDAFGPERIITKSESNVLYEIDDKSALTLYKEYLGKFADELPGSALLFPLCITSSNDQGTLVRTILSIDKEKESLTFAGDMPTGSKVRFMTANFDRIIDAASVAAYKSFDQPLNRKPDYALLISCVGRKLILNNRVDEEVEAVSDTFGKNTVLSGFYSYGELSPFNEGSKCQLHNQTMTITTFTEI
jgi:hypothetical protein